MPSIPLPTRLFLFKRAPLHRDLHSFPTRRSSDLGAKPYEVNGCNNRNCDPQAQNFAEPISIEDGKDKAFISHHSVRSEEHTSELQSRVDLVCRLLLEKKNSSLHPRSYLSWIRSAT